MKAYLAALIQEQIHRGMTLKQIVPHPLNYPELNALAERCHILIDGNIQHLNWLLKELRKRPDNDLRDIYRTFRACTKEIALVEYFGISPLYHQNPEIGYLTKLVYKVHQEINLPMTPPAVTCISTTYYHFHPFTNVILVPIGEPHFLLHLPDLFHEIGHEILSNKDKEPRLQKIAESFKAAIHQITDYYTQLHETKKRETGPPQIPRLVSHIHDQWKDWINEFFCDLFALLTLGPAYAWAHLHLVVKKSENIYEFSDILRQSHPSDDARMKILTTALKNLGFNKQTAEITSTWKALPITTATQPVPEYQYAYPDDLLQKICTITLQGIKESGFSVVTPNKLEALGQDSIVRLLNNAWQQFWNNSETFRQWEQQQISKLKSRLIPK